MNSIRSMWQELWWEIAEGDATRYSEIKRMDVFEFYPFFDKWRERRAEINAMNKKPK